MASFNDVIALNAKSAVVRSTLTSDTWFSAISACQFLCFNHELGALGQTLVLMEESIDRGLVA